MNNLRQILVFTDFLIKAKLEIPHAFYYNKNYDSKICLFIKNIIRTVLLASYF